jgi:hypothetical protein
MSPWECPRQQRRRFPSVPHVAVRRASNPVGVAPRTHLAALQFVLVRRGGGTSFDQSCCAHREYLAGRESMRLTRLLMSFCKSDIEKYLLVEMGER